MSVTKPLIVLYLGIDTLLQLFRVPLTNNHSRRIDDSNETVESEQNKEIDAVDEINPYEDAVVENENVFVNDAVVNIDLSQETVDDSERNELAGDSQAVSGFEGSPDLFASGDLALEPVSPSQGNELHLSLSSDGCDRPSSSEVGLKHESFTEETLDEGDSPPLDSGSSSQEPSQSILKRNTSCGAVTKKKLPKRKEVLGRHSLSQVVLRPSHHVPSAKY